MCMRVRLFSGLFGLQRPERLAERDPQCLDEGSVSRLPLERRHDDRVEVIGQHDVTLGREVSKERAFGNLDRIDDLLHGRGLVTLLAEQAHRLPPDHLPGALLLPLAQAGSAQLS